MKWKSYLPTAAVAFGAVFLLQAAGNDSSRPQPAAASAQAEAGGTGPAPAEPAGRPAFRVLTVPQMPPPAPVGISHADSIEFQRKKFEDDLNAAHREGFHLAGLNGNWAVMTLQPPAAGGQPSRRRVVLATEPPPAEPAPGAGPQDTPNAR